MQCPLCRVELKIAERHGIEIDYCPRCRGIWPGRGEPDKIIERVGSFTYPESRPTPGHPPERVPYGEPRGKEGHYDHKKRLH
jgi:uncharacterized protein